MYFTNVSGRKYMVNPLEELIIYSHPLGSSVEVYWTLPVELPENYNIYFFKRSKINVTDAEINAYFTWIDEGKDPKTYVQDGLSIWDAEYDLKNKKAVFDYSVRNGVQQFYRAVIRDEDAKEQSSIESGVVTPECNIVIDVVDGKDIVVKSLVRMLDSLKDKNGTRIKIGKDIDIVRQFTIEDIKIDRIIVERINGSSQYSFWANHYANQGQNIILGEMDIDVIRVTYLTLGGVDKRDTMATVFRGKKIWLQTMCKRLGVKDARITIEGDYWNPELHGVRAIGFTAVFSLLVENKEKINQTEISQHLFEMNGMKNYDESWVYLSQEDTDRILLENKQYLLII